MKKMKRVFCLLSVVLFLSPVPLWAKPRIVHVLVALCDNENQGIVPVPAALGKGDDPAGNLYWGALYGVSTFLKRQKEWQFEKKIINPAPAVLERLIFKLKSGDIYLIADAYDGRYIKAATEDLFSFTVGQKKVPVELNDQKLSGGSDADLLVYMGHNGLMDFSVSPYPLAVSDPEKLTGRVQGYMPVLKDGKKREVAVFACHSEKYFKKQLLLAGASPLILTRDFMAPEAYILDALVSGWQRNEPDHAIRERVAAAYHKYQKCGLKAARRMFGSESSKL